MKNKITEPEVISEIMDPPGYLIMLGKVTSKDGVKRKLANNHQVLIAVHEVVDFLVTKEKAQWPAKVIINLTYDTDIFQNKDTIFVEILMWSADNEVFDWCSFTCTKDSLTPGKNFRNTCLIKDVGSRHFRCENDFLPVQLKERLSVLKDAVSDTL